MIVEGGLMLSLRRNLERPYDNKDFLYILFVIGVLDTITVLVRTG
jgi:hypothetical protein